jgi:hypothetical protein
MAKVVLVEQVALADAAQDERHDRERENLKQRDPNVVWADDEGSKRGSGNPPGYELDK